MDQPRRFCRGSHPGRHIMEEKSCVISGDGVGVRCDIFLRRQESELSRTAIQALMALGEVRVNGIPVKAHYKLRAQDRLAWRVPEKPTSDLIAEDIPFNILYEDNEV